MVPLNRNDIVELSDADAIPIASQMSQAIHAGLSLESGLRALAEQTRSPRTRRALMNLSESLEQGMPLAEALRASRTGLPRQMKALVEAGLESGRLDSVMRYCIEQYQRASAMRQFLWIGLSYPLFLIWFAFLICGGTLMIIIPGFGNILTDFNTELPTVTAGLVALSSLVLVFGWQPWLVLMLGLVVFYVVFATFGLSSWGQRWMTTIPIVGRIFRYAALMDLCQLLATLAESGLSFTKSLRFAGGASDDRWLNRKCQLIADDVEQGTPPSNAAAQVGLPTTLCQVFREASSEQTLAQALRGLADIYAAQSQVTSQLVNTVVSQLAVAFVLGFAGITVVAFFVPLIKLLNDLS